MERFTMTLRALCGTLAAALLVAGTAGTAGAQWAPPPMSGPGAPPAGVTPYAGTTWGQYGTANRGLGWGQYPTQSWNTYASRGWGQYGPTGWQRSDPNGYIRYGNAGRGYTYTYNPETGLYQYYGVEPTQQRNRYEPIE